MPVKIHKRRANKLANRIEKVMDVLVADYGWKFDGEELSNTPVRVSKMFEEMSEKIDYEKFTAFDNTEQYGDMVIQKHIKFYAFCAHHILPFYGEVNIAYIPRDKVIGLSKLARIVSKYAYQAQLQERLTQQIASKILEETDAVGVMVVVKAQHLCMMLRGVEQHEAETVTSGVRGVFDSDEKARAEALRLMGV